MPHPDQDKPQNSHKKPWRFQNWQVNELSLIMSFLFNIKIGESSEGPNQENFFRTNWGDTPIQNRCEKYTFVAEDGVKCSAGRWLAGRFDLACDSRILNCLRFSNSGFSVTGYSGKYVIVRYLSSLLLNFIAEKDLRMRRLIANNL